jgi:5'-nucleotidase
MLKILITNDDGLESNGLRHLEEEFSPYAEVYAVAPDRQRSATSQAITIYGTLRLMKVRPRHYMVNGYPADCVSVALFSGKFPKFDIVISGINHGWNLGDDVHYSGTVGAARHGCIHGLKSIAVSAPYHDHKADMRRVSEFVRKWVLSESDYLHPETVYNINYPDEGNIRVDADMPLPDYIFTSQGSRTYVDNFEEIETGEDYSVLQLKECVIGNKEEIGSDFRAVTDGLISITPISLNTTNTKELQKRLSGVYG